MRELTEAGLGLSREELRLERTTARWLAAGSRLRDAVAAVVADAASPVELIGSSSVPGMLAKPIIDLAVGLGPGRALHPLRDRLEGAGWIYRGDAGDDGGHVFVLEARPGLRVAHVHVVESGGAPWRDYLALRDLLRTSAGAREQYEVAKLHLIDVVGHDRRAYTAGKSAVVSTLLASTR